MEKEKIMRYALLIDADNISKKYIKNVVEELSKYGTITIKRIYGDLTANCQDWKDIVNFYAMIPIQQFAYTTGRNSADSALIIDAMDLLYKNEVEGFCIASSDSDFTRLAIRIKESGKTVIGMGEEKTPKSLVNSCTEFKYLETISGEETSVENSNRDTIRKEIITIISESGDDGKIYLGLLGTIITNRFPDFDPRTYGFNSLNKLLASFDKDFTLSTDKTSFYVTLKGNTNLAEISNMIINIINSEKNNTINMSQLGNIMYEKNPDFSPKIYGYTKFSSLLRNIKGIKIVGNNVKLIK